MEDAPQFAAGFITAVCVLLCSAIFSACFADATSITYKDYEDQLASSQLREKTAKEEIATEQGKIEAVKQQISDATQQIATVINETYALAGTNEAGLAAAEAEASLIKQDFVTLLGLAPEELTRRAADIKALDDRIGALRAKPLSGLSRMAARLSELAQLSDQVKSRIKLAVPQTVPTNAAAVSDKPNSYTVKSTHDNRECLYRISGYDFVFGDPAKWPYLYRANQSIIDKGFRHYKNLKKDGARYSRAADLIYPGQVLDIPR
jgi:hypothetical protein